MPLFLNVLKVYADERLNDKFNTWGYEYGPFEYWKHLNKKTRWHPFVWYSNGRAVWYSNGIQIPDLLASNLIPDI